MEKKVEAYKNARVRRNIAFVVMLLSWALMIAFIIFGALVFPARMTPFMIAALFAGGAGTAVYFALNHVFYARERNVCAAMLQARMTADKASAIARELRLDMKILKVYFDGV